MSLIFGGMHHKKVDPTKFRIAWRKAVHPDQKLKEADFFAKGRHLSLSIAEGEQLNAILVQGLRRLDAYLREEAAKEMETADGGPPPVVDSGLIIPGSPEEAQTQSGIIIPFGNPKGNNGG